MMQRIHGSVAKLVNALLPQRRLPFWRRAGHQDYFDGCIRGVLQAERAYWYTLKQAQRHGIVKDWRTYRHTHIGWDLKPAIARAVELHAFLEDVPYARYERRGRFSDHERKDRKHGR